MMMIHSQREATAWRCSVNNLLCSESASVQLSDSGRPTVVGGRSLLHTVYEMRLTSCS